ncbi:MAG: phosphopantetheine-binding protein [Oscillospiraceae bacterium]|nr:phosphopantetheine-binding protein [Oscillospiraceae bacterium]
MERLLQILNSLHPETDFRKETALVDGGLLDSFDIITLIQEISDAYGVDVDLEYVEPENFNSVEAIAGLLRRLGAEF